jgi:hypothetical protein
LTHKSAPPLTRAHGGGYLVLLEKPGYNPNISDPSYPSNIQAAQARVSATQLAQAPTQSSDYGSVANGSSQSGRTTGAQSRALGAYFGQ